MMKKPISSFSKVFLFPCYSDFRCYQSRRTISCQTVQLYFSHRRCTHLFAASSSDRGVISAQPQRLTFRVGVSAYLGAVPFISSTTLLPAGGSILPVEARHNTFLLVANKGNPIPSAFDTPLSFNLVFTIASAFIASCPASSPPLPFTAFPPLVATTSAVKAGDIVTLGGAPLNNGTFAVVISGLNTFPVPLFNNQFIFPNDTSISGQVYLVLSTNGSVTDDQIRAGPAILNAN